MKLIFLAGGQGKRTAPLQTDKALIPFMGKSAFYHVLKQFKEVGGFDSVVIVSNPGNEKAFGNIASELGIKAKMVTQKRPLGMADAIFSAQEFVKGEVLIANSEDFFDKSALKGVLDKIKTGADMVLCGLEVKKYFPGGYFKLNKNKVAGLVEKPGAGNEPSNLTKLVLDYFKDGKSLVKALRQAKTQNDDLYEVALNNLIKSGLKVELSKYSGAWQAIKYPWHILGVMDYLLKSLGDEVVMEEGVKVFEGAVIKGPSYIGKNSVIGGNTLVRQSIIGEDSVIGFDTEVARSWVGNNSWFHKNYVGDSVIEGDFEMGSGAITANLRLDGKEIKVGNERISTGLSKLGMMAGKGVRIGCNSTTLPGVRIGSNSLIGAGVVVSRDVPENSKIILKQEYQVSKFGGDETDYKKFKKRLNK